MILLIPAFLCTFLGALFLMVPDMTRRGILFAVNVPRDFRDSPPGRQAVATYRAIVLFTLFIDLAGLALAPTRMLGTVFVLGPVPLLLVASAGYLWQRRKILPFAVQPAAGGVRVAELSSEPDRIPWFAWLGALPFAFLGAAAAYLDINWERIPARFPVHWNALGVPNRWSERTTRGIYGILLFATEMCAFLLVMALAGWFGARRSYMRRVMLGTLIAVESMMGLMFALIAVNPVLQLPVAATILPPLALLALIVLITIRRVSESDEVAEPTPEEFWHGQMVYYNPDDPALFVEKRVGMGYTLNFGNRWSWALCAALIAIVASIRPLLL